MTFLDHLLNESRSPEATARRERERAEAEATAAREAATAAREAEVTKLLRELATALDTTNDHDHHADLDRAGFRR